MSVIGSGKRNGFPSKPLRDSSPKRSRPLLVPSRFSPLALLNPHGDQRETAITQKPPEFHKPISTKHPFPSKLAVRWVGKAKFHPLCCPAGQQPHKTTRDLRQKISKLNKPPAVLPEAEQKFKPSVHG